MTIGNDALLCPINLCGLKASVQFHHDAIRVKIKRYFEAAATTLTRDLHVSVLWCVQRQRLWSIGSEIRSAICFSALMSDLDWKQAQMCFHYYFFFPAAYCHCFHFNCVSPKCPSFFFFCEHPLTISSSSLFGHLLIQPPNPKKKKVVFFKWWTAVPLSPVRILTKSLKCLYWNRFHSHLLGTLKMWARSSQYWVIF